jgi:hypothetical protein
MLTTASRAATSARTPSMMESSTFAELMSVLFPFFALRLPSRSMASLEG